MVDSNDRERMDGTIHGNDDNAKDELHRLLNETELENAALLIFANKQDLPNAMSVEQIKQSLQLNTIQNREWYIQASCASTGDGLFEGLDWLSQTLTKKKQSKK